MTTSQPGTHPAIPEPFPLPAPPQRISLDDDEIARALAPELRHPGTTLDALHQLEEQLLLRDSEAREFRDWEGRMRAIGTPEALTSVDAVRTDYVQVIHPIEVPGLKQGTARSMHAVYARTTAANPVAAVRDRPAASVNWASRMLRRLFPVRSGR